MGVNNGLRNEATVYCTACDTTRAASIQNS